MIQTNIRGVEFIAVNTDRQALDTSCAAKKLVIGDKTTGGKGAGANPAAGRQSAEESEAQIREILNGTDMLFITAGMGGGTGTGAAPIVAKIAKDMGILTVAIVTKPFTFEGRRRMMQAEAGIEELSHFVDSLIVIPNEKLKQIESENLQFGAAFEIADDILRRGVQSVSDIINFPGLVNLDFADITTIMKNAGYAHMGVGKGNGEGKAKLAATMAISSPLLSTSIAGATGVLVSITASPDIQLSDIDIASTMIHEEAHPDANIIWGTTFNENLKDEMRITIIATGFSNKVENGVAPTKLDAPAIHVPAPQPKPVEQEAYAPVSEPAKQPELTVSEVEVAPLAEEPDVQIPTVSEAFAPITKRDEAATVKASQDTSAEASCREYEQLFKCIQRIKRN
jgi:cell division protein FtsZ